MPTLPLVPEESTLSCVDFSIYVDHTGKHYGILAYLLHRVGFPDEVIENMRLQQIEVFVCRLYLVNIHNINDLRTISQKHGYNNVKWFVEYGFTDPMKETR